MRTDGEFARIAALLRELPSGEGVVLGPGDDAAILRPRADCDLVATIDTFVEGRHFRRDLFPAEAIGARLAAANLSDLAAMAAEPRWALVSFAVPQEWSEDAVRAIELAAAAAFAAEGACVVGGNLVSTNGPLVATVALLGEVERGRHWGRAGARVGDVLAVTGAPGAARVALTAAKHGTALPAHYLAPPCRVRVARLLAAAGGVTAAIDLSDGLPGDLAHLTRASGLGAELRAQALGPGALLPSDDYELLLAIDPTRFNALALAARQAGAALTVIGECVEQGLWLRSAQGERQVLGGEGFDHFAGLG